MREIQIIDLLCQREAELVKVAQVEEAVSRLLGGAVFPFPPAPDLPSRRKVTSKKKSRVAVSLAEASFPGVRKLDAPTENAYRVRYRFNGEEKESFQNDFDFLQNLLRFPASAFELLSIETVFYRKLNDWQLRQELWKAK